MSTHIFRASTTPRKRYSNHEITGSRKIRISEFLPPDDATFGSAVGSDGPYASIKFWWREYPCNGSLTYDLLICRVDHECIGDTTSVATYALRHGPVIPVVFWNHYHLTVNATCGEKSERYQEFYADTGPGGELGSFLSSAIQASSSFDAQSAR